MEGGAAKMIVERATRLGQVRGIERLGVETYWGLRYAQPAERFRASQLQASPWTDIYDATRPGAMAPQPPVSPDIYGRIADPQFAEDCLFLNIHRPKAASSSPRPVIVFIHGGSFTSGGANFYDGTALARGADAVVVCINYRLGVFAAFDLDWLGSERDGGGQLWLGDQITALKWIRDNIADYGGDPDLVTVTGESAGAVSTAALCAAPQAEGLVHRAVAFSTADLVAEPSRDVVATIAKTRRCSRAQAVDYLKSAPAEALIGLQKRGKRLSPIPVSNTPLLPGRMEELIRARGANAVPMIAGFMTNEGLSMELMIRHGLGLPWPLPGLIFHFGSRAVAMHAAKGRANVPAYIRRLKTATRSFGFGRRFNDLLWTDGFRRGAMDYAEETTRAGSRGYVFVMDVPMRIYGKRIPCSHGLDVSLTFNAWDDPEHTVPKFADHPNAPALARRWVAMLAHFARHGEPGKVLGEWPVHEPQQRASLRVTADGCTVERDVAAVFRKDVWRSA
jgi:para-nitrobenzyl esterase